MTSDQAVRLRSVLSDLENGRMNANDAAAVLRTMKFPVAKQKTVSRTLRESAENNAPEPAQEGSFSEVAQAYFDGRINLRQYEVLAEAAAEAMKGDEPADQAAVRSPGHDSD